MKDTVQVQIVSHYFVQIFFQLFMVLSDPLGFFLLVIAIMVTFGESFNILNNKVA